MRLPWTNRKPAAEPEMRVLMVCLGNICRSPTAEGALRVRLARAGLAERVHVDSAGTAGFHAGDPPDPRAQRHAQLRGIDLSALRGRRVVAEDFDRHHLVLAMDEDNLADLQRLRPDGHPNQPQLLLAFARRYTSIREVPDPYYGGPDGFERVLDLIEDACDGLVLHLQQRLDEGRGGTS